MYILFWFILKAYMMTQKRSFTLVFIIYRMTLFDVNHSFYWCANISESHIMLLNFTTWCFKHSLIMNMYTVYANEASFWREIRVENGVHRSMM